MNSQLKFLHFIFSGACVLMFVLFCLQTHSQTSAPQIIWEKTYGGSLQDEFRSLVLNNKGGFTAASYASSQDDDVDSTNGGADYWIVKGDSNGNILWKKAYGGSEDDYARSLIKTSDGGYLVSGQTFSNDGDVIDNHGNFDYWILKLNPSGNISWKKTFGGSAFDNAYCGIQTSDSNYVIAGFTESFDGDVTDNHGGQDFYVMKLDASGNKIWAKSYGGTLEEQAACVIETNDHAYLVVGFASSTDGDVTDNKGDRDFWVVKLKPNGKILWKKSYGGTDDDAARWVEQTPDHGYIIAGYAVSNDVDVTGNHGAYDYWVIKIDSAGTLQWQKTFGGSQSDYAYSIHRCNDGGFVMAGIAISSNGDVTNSHGNGDIWVVKCDSMGNLLWEKALGGSDLDEGRMALEMANGNFMITGFTSSHDGDISDAHGEHDGWVIKICGSPPTFYSDADHDGYGNPNISAVACSAPAGYVSNNLDCNDNKPAVHPEAPEFCNGIDDDCSGIKDDNISPPVITASGSTTFCSGGSVLLTANNAGFLASYQWYLSGVPIANATSATYTAALGGNYSFNASYQSCSSSSNIIMVTVNVLPTASITNGATVNSCKGEDVILNAVTDAGYLYQWNQDGIPVNGATGFSYTYTAKQSADFTVTVTSSAGCSATSAAASVNKLDKPSAIITPLGDLNICYAGQVTLQANSGDGFKYKWYKNDVKIQDSNSQTYTATTTGDYTVKVTNANDCKKTSKITTVYSSCKSANENASMNISVSPNPSDGNFLLTIFSDHENQTAVTTLFDLVGREVMKQSLFLQFGRTTAALKIPTAYSNGIYFLRVQMGGDVQVVRVTIER